MCVSRLYLFSDFSWGFVKEVATDYLCVLRESEMMAFFIVLLVLGGTTTIHTVSRVPFIEPNCLFVFS